MFFLAVAALRDAPFLRRVAGVRPLQRRGGGGPTECRISAPWRRIVRRSMQSTVTVYAISHAWGRAFSICRKGKSGRKNATVYKYKYRV